jgi:hypothetical protein
VSRSPLTFLHAFDKSRTVGALPSTRRSVQAFQRFNVNAGTPVRPRNALRRGAVFDDLLSERGSAGENAFGEELGNFLP